MKINNVILALEPYYERILPTGSRVIVSDEDQEKNPPNDEDYLILVTPGNRVLIEARLQQEGWELGGSLPNQGPLTGDWNLNTEHTYTPEGVIDMHFVFHSWKRQETPMQIVPGHEDEIFPPVIEGSGPKLNLLVTCNERYFDDFTRATFLSRALNLTQKDDRVLVFEALTCDVWPNIEYKHKKRKLEKYWNPTAYYVHGTATAPTWLAPHPGQINPAIVVDDFIQAEANALGTLGDVDNTW